MTTRTIGSEFTGNSCLIGKWPSNRLPLTVKMSDEFDSDYHPVNDLVGGLNPLEQMAKVWNNATSPLTLINENFPTTATHGYASTNSFNDSEIGIYKSTSWFTNVSSSALAITQFYGTVEESAGLGRHINLSHADIIVNYRDYGGDFTMVNNLAYDYDLPTVILHEMGHLLGLCHEVSRPSVMAPYYLVPQRTLKAYDADIIKDIYVDGVISGLSTNSNALTAPVGSEVRGVIELHANGKCIHKVDGKITYEHQVSLKPQLRFP